MRVFFVGYCGVDGGDCVDGLIVFSALRFRFGVDLDYNRLAWSFLIWVVDVWVCDFVERFTWLELRCWLFDCWFPGVV